MSASMKALVLDLAMAPGLLMRSALVIPMLESSMVSLLLALSGMGLICSSGSLSRTDKSVRL